MPAFFILMLKAWGITAVLMVICWLIAVKNKNAGWVDVGWTSGLAACAWVYALNTPGAALRHLFLATAVSLWALRLLKHLLQRFITDGHEDKRYRKIRTDWKTGQDSKFFFFFQFQAFLDVVLSICWLPSMYNTSVGVSPLEIAGILLWAIGFWGESVADHQLKVFKADLANRGKTCQQGLWYYSRHPNYFFEWLMWLAYMVFALSSVWGWTAFLSPALMYYFLMKVSGVPLAEAQALQSRGEEYRRYQETTSVLIPWFKSKGEV